VLHLVKSQHTGCVLQRRPVQILDLEDPSILCLARQRRAPVEKPLPLRCKQVVAIRLTTAPASQCLGQRADTPRSRDMTHLFVMNKGPEVYSDGHFSLQVPLHIDSILWSTVR